MNVRCVERERKKKTNSGSQTGYIFEGVCRGRASQRETDVGWVSEKFTAEKKKLKQSKKKE